MVDRTKCQASEYLAWYGDLRNGRKIFVNRNFESDSSDAKSARRKRPRALLHQNDHAKSERPDDRVGKIICGAGAGARVTVALGCRAEKTFAQGQTRKGCTENFVEKRRAKPRCRMGFAKTHRRKMVNRNFAAGRNFAKIESE